MKKKPRAKGLEQKIDHLTKVVARGFKDLGNRMERGFATVAEDIGDIQDIMATKDDVKRLEAKTDGVDSKLGGFENREVGKRLQLTVRVGAIETHLDLKPPVGTVS